MNRAKIDTQPSVTNKTHTETHAVEPTLSSLHVYRKHLAAVRLSLENHDRLSQASLESDDRR